MESSDPDRASSFIHAHDVAKGDCETRDLGCVDDQALTETPVELNGDDSVVDALV